MIPNSFHLGTFQIVRCILRYKEILKSGMNNGQTERSFRMSVRKEASKEKRNKNNTIQENQLK
jgi:hypothetical protein